MGSFYEIGKIVMSFVTWLVFCILVRNRNQQNVKGRSEFYIFKPKGIWRKLSAPVLIEQYTTVSGFVLILLFELSCISYIVILACKIKNLYILFPAMNWFVSIVLAVAIEAFISIFKVNKLKDRILCAFAVVGLIGAVVYLMFG